MALSGGHSVQVTAREEQSILRGRERVTRIPGRSADECSDDRPHGRLRLLRACGSAAAGLLRGAAAALPHPRRWRERRRARERAAEVEAVVLGSPGARGWPRDDVPGLYSSLAWLAAKLAVGAAAALVASPLGPLASAVGKVTTGVVGGRMGYRFGRKLDRIEVGHVRQYLQDVRDAAAAGMPPEACTEYAAMCDAGPYAVEDDICRWRPLWAGRGGDWRRAVAGRGEAGEVVA